MTFYIENSIDVVISFPLEQTIEKIIREALLLEECPYECEITLIITNNEGIQSYNKEFRNIDRSTDVLSFPNIEYDSPADFSHLEDKGFYADCFNLDSGELMLGDMIISYETIVEQAHLYNNSIYREFSFMVIHSMLHLLGYDHIEDLDRKIMEQKQKELLKRLGITHDS